MADDEVRISLSIPRSLAERMKKHSEYQWGKIAASLFERVLERSETVDDVITAASRGDLGKIKRISEQLRKNYTDIDVDKFKKTE